LGFLACGKIAGKVIAGAFEKYIREKADTVSLQLYLTGLIISFIVKRALDTARKRFYGR
jgi:hypothetical protein